MPDETAILRIEVDAGTRNDGVLTPSELELARNTLSDLRNELISLDLRRKDISARLQRLQVAIAPHKRIPPEILSLIFVLALPQAATRPPAKNLEHMPWSLLSVCRPWRQVAIRTSALWDSLRLRPNRHKRPSFLSSAAAGPISLCMPAWTSTDEEDEYRSLLSSQASRIVGLGYLNPHVITMLNSVHTSWGLSNLTSFDLYIDHFTSDDPRIPCLPLLLKDSVNLQQVKFSFHNYIPRATETFPAIYDALVHHDFPTTNVVVLDLGGTVELSPRQCKQLLVRFKRLEELSITVKYDESVPVHDLALPYLRSLSLLGKGFFSFVEALLKQFRDQLTSLRVPFESRNELHTILQYLNGKSLERLVGVQEADDHDRLFVAEGEDLYKDISLPNIRHIALRKCSSDLGLLLPSIIAPKLEHFELHIYLCTTGFPADAIVQMVARSGCAPVRLSFDGVRTPKVRQYFPIARDFFSQACIQTLAKLDIPSTVLDVETLRDIGDGAVLPSLSWFACSIDSTPTPVLDMIRQRIALEERNGAFNPTVAPILTVQASVRLQQPSFKTGLASANALREFSNLRSETGRDYNLRIYH